MLARHAIATAEVAAIGDADPEVAERAAQGIRERLLCVLHVEARVLARAWCPWRRGVRFAATSHVVGLSTMKPYEFEAIGDDLELMPLSARRAADAAGLRPSLGAWRALAREARGELARLGAEAELDVARIVTILSAAVPLPETIETGGEPPASTAPEALCALLPPDLPLTDAVWSALRPLDRY